MAALDDALADAAGVPTVVGAVQKSTRMRAEPGHRVAGGRLALQAPARPAQAARTSTSASAGKALSGTARTSIPAATQVQRARVDTEVRARGRRGLGRR